jgi:hypothetical protein
MKWLALPLALAAGLTLTPGSVRADDPDDVRPAELIEKARKVLDEARALHEQAMKHEEDAARLEREAEAKRDEARCYQRTALQHDFVAAQNRLKAYSLRRDADDKDIYASYAEQRTRELDDRSKVWLVRADYHRKLAGDKRERARNERDLDSRTRLETQARVNEEEADRETKVADSLKRDSDEAAKRAQRFRDQALAARREADRLDPGGTASEPTELKASMRRSRTDDRCHMEDKTGVPERTPDELVPLPPPAGER